MENRLTLIKRLNKKGSSGNYYGLYKCKCGKEKEIIISNVKSGRIKSCGCLGKETSSKNGKANIKHGMKNSSEYKSWQAMKSRCYNKNNKSYKNYGGRGITICERWRNSFEHFLEDMKPKPEPKRKYSIERINNDGNYEPKNCKWILRILESRNQRSNINITFNSKTQILADWSRELNINYMILYNRLYKSNWSIERAFTIA